MPIKFSIAKRGLLPTESNQQIEATDNAALLRPVLSCPETVDAVEFQSSSSRLPSLMPKGELSAALNTLQRVMVHEMEKGNAVTLPGIGTFRLSLKGQIGVESGKYHGQDVRVDGILFRPDRELLAEVRGLDVEQVPCGQDFRTEEDDVEARLARLFERKPFVTHKDVATAFAQTLSRNRITTLLGKLVRQGRIVREGKGAQTVYRAAQS